MNTIYITPERLQTVEQVRKLIQHWMETDGLNFHPDTPMEEYMSGTNNAPVFDREKAARYNLLLDRCFEICRQQDTDIYLLSLEVLQSVHPGFFRK